jgi:Uma2 family endonuclease
MGGRRALPDISRTEDFLAWIGGQDHKFEMIEGRLVMMAGGSRRHARIAVNTTSALNVRLAGGPCVTYNSDFLVEASGKNRYYPDVSVACGETRDFTDRPVLVVEVLSPDTQREDLGPKLQNYLRMPGLRHLLYLWPDEPRARLWTLDEGGEAEPREIEGLDAVVELPGLGLSLPMAELYRDVGPVSGAG